MTIRIGDVWESATEVLAARGRGLFGVAMAAFVLPAAVQSALQLWGGGATAAAALAGLVGIAGVVLSLWGHLAVVAIAGEPPVAPGAARRLGWRRLLAALLVALVLAGLVFALFVPVALILAATGFDWTAAAGAARGGAAMPSISPVAAALIVLVALLLLPVALWLSARLFLLYPVVLHERPAMAAFGRSFALTRGLTFPLIGAILLFGIAGLVATAAARSVIGLAIGLPFGSPTAAAFAGAVAGACVTAAWIVVVQAFAARLYAAVSGAAPAPVARVDGAVALPA